jgi:hypothetical protein
MNRPITLTRNMAPVFGVLEVCVRQEQLKPPYQAEKNLLAFECAALMLATCRFALASS